MAARFTLIAAALVLALTGCTHRIGTAPVQPVAVPVAAETGPISLQAQAEPAYAAAQPAVEPGYPDASYRLDSGDRLRIVVFGQQNLSRSYSVDGGGYISMPLIGAVAARGLTTFQLEQRIAEQLREKYVKEPKVSAEIETYRPFFILGEVRRAGQFPYVSGMTVQTAVAIAGGYSERAKRNKVRLTRRVNGYAANYMVPTNTPVQPGDTIYVKERFF